MPFTFNSVDNVPFPGVSESIPAFFTWFGVSEILLVSTVFSPEGSAVVSLESGLQATSVAAMMNGYIKCFMLVVLSV